MGMPWIDIGRQWRESRGSAPDGRAGFNSNSNSGIEIIQMTGIVSNFPLFIGRETLKSCRNCN